MDENLNSLAYLLLQGMPFYLAEDGVPVVRETTASICKDACPSELQLEAAPRGFCVSKPVYFSENEKEPKENIPKATQRRGFINQQTAKSFPFKDEVHKKAHDDPRHSSAHPVHRTIPEKARHDES